MSAKCSVKKLDKNLQEAQLSLRRPIVLRNAYDVRYSCRTESIIYNFAIMSSFQLSVFAYTQRTVKACPHWRQKSPETVTKSIHLYPFVAGNGYFLSPFSATFVASVDRP